MARVEGLPWRCKAGHRACHPQSSGLNSTTHQSCSGWRGDLEVRKRGVYCERGGYSERGCTARQRYHVYRTETRPPFGIILSAYLDLTDTWTLSSPTNAFGCQECLIRTLKVLSQTCSPRKILTATGLLLLCCARSFHAPAYYHIW